jgi:3-phenylpropionate/trans-cinnamate dioxygenase ferredoxin component
MTHVWRDTGAAEDFAVGTPRCERLGEVPVVVVRAADGFYAVRNVCPHAGLPLGDGEVRGKTITCPYHGFTYRLTDGADIDDPFGDPATVYPVKVEAGRVLVGLPIE